MKSKAKDYKEKAFCKLPEGIERDLPAGIDPRRASLIRVIGKTWVNGTQIHYCFWDHTKHQSPRAWTAANEGEKDVVRDSFQEWKNVGIGLEFVEVDDPNDAEVRIGFHQGDGSWSYIGTTVLEIPQNERTMNFGWSLTADWYGKETATHEIGHTLAFPHAHQNPQAGIEWDVNAVYSYFRGHPNYWDDDTTFYNVLRKIPINQVDGSPWDPDSIMQYRFDAALINGPEPYNIDGVSPAAGLSQSDIGFVKRFYPPLKESKYQELEAYQSEHVNLVAGEQRDFIIRPKSNRKYVIQTFGAVDTLLVLFEKDGNNDRYLDSDDDAGFGRNARIAYRLFKDREYILRLRFYYGDESGNTAVLMY